MLIAIGPELTNCKLRTGIPYLERVNNLNIQHLILKISFV